MPLFKEYTPEDIQPLLKLRAGETKIGESLRTGVASAKWVLLGAPEDVGVLANGGKTGTRSAWQPFLEAFLNLPHNPFLDLRAVSLGGVFDFSSLYTDLATDEDTLRQQVERIDAVVQPVVEALVSNGQIPILIGGGHNNAFPLIAGTCLALREGLQDPHIQINCINLDPHADFRHTEGRHSGNAFRYAAEAGYLARYALPVLHENYNAESIIEALKEDTIFHISTWEDIFLRNRLTYHEALTNALTFVHDGKRVGIELDLDSIEGVLSSAQTPVGLSPAAARQYLYMATQQLNVGYVHICEAAAHMDDGRSDASTGKLLAYLVSDLFRKA